MIELALPSGVRATICPRGATLHALWVPDREGRLDDILLGPELPGAGPDGGPESGPASGPGPGGGPRLFMGTTVGRFANRIAGAAFTLDGTTHRLAANDGPHCLHGGPDGFDLRDWTVAASAPEAVTLRLVSPDGDQGFPGRLAADVVYALSDTPGGPRLDITMAATTDAPTPISLTNHACLNLGGVGDPARLQGTADHRLTVAASRYLPVTPQAIPLPQAPAPVEGTPFDFRRGARLGDRLRDAHPQIRAMGGVDHCLCLDGAGFRHAARVADPRSGRVVDLFTDQPGLQVYTGNGLDGSARGKGGAAWHRWDGLCLEPGAWPDAPNRPDFPAAILRPGARYLHRMALVFPPPA